MIKTIRLFIGNLKLNLFEFIFHFFPLKNKVVFSNFYGKGVGDDPKYIMISLLKDGFNGEIIWVVSNKNISVPKGVKRTRYCSIAYIYHICTAKVWVFNIKSLWKKRKRKGQFYIQTWHSTLALKKVEQAAESTLGKYVEISKKDSKMIDLLYTNNDFRYRIFKRDFWYSGEVKKIDVPRASVLIHPPPNLKENIFSHFHIERTKKIVLYAPTFRKNVDMSLYIWDYNRVLDSLENKFNGEFVMLVRMHPQLAEYSKNIPYGNRIINASLYPDMQELLAIADVLINDFSSTMFEFGYLHKPVFLFATDVADYVKNDRGMEFRFEQLPFTMSNSLDKLVLAIEQFNNESYIRACIQFYNEIGMNDHGHGSEILSEIIRKRMEYPHV